MQPKLRRCNTSQQRREAGAEEIAELRRCDAARRRRGTEAEEKLELRQSSDGAGRGRIRLGWTTRRRLELAPMG